MSIVNDKRSIINEIGVLSSIGKTVETPDQNFTFQSINNRNEPVPFMLDLLTACIGSEALIRVTGQIMTNFIRTIEPDLKKNVKKQSVTYNSNKQLPTTFTNNGYSVPTSKIDLFSKLKTDPSSTEGSLLYQNNVNSFDQKAYNAISNPNTDVVFGNMKLNYNDNTDNMNIKPVDGNQTIGGFVNGYVDNLTIIDEKEFTTSVLDTMYGSISKNTNKNKNIIFEEEKLKRILEKLGENDEFATLTENELKELEKLSNEKFNGIVSIDVGCSIIDSVVNVDDILNLINNNLNNNDPLNVGNSYNNLMENSFGRVPQQTNPSNKNAIRDGFFKRLIKTITGAILFALTSTPQIRVLLALINGFKNNDDTTFPENNTDDLNSQKNYINCIGKSASGLINKFIFSLLKNELLKITTPAAKILLREKIRSYINIIKSLI